MPYCSNCGDWVEAEDSFCESCGGDVESAGKSGGGAGGPASGETTQGQQSRKPHSDMSGLKFAYKYPKSDSWTVAVINYLLVLGSFLVIPALILYGRGYRVARAAALGRADAPKYEDVAGLIVDGLRFLVVILVMNGVLVLLFGMFSTAAVDPETGNVSGPMFAMTVVSMAALGYVMPAFVTAFVASNSVTSGFTDGRAVSLLKSVYYLKAFVLSLLVVGGFSLAIGLLIAIQITVIAVPFVVAHMVLGLSAYWGYVYDQANVRGIVPPPVEDEPSADEAATDAAGQPSP